MKTTDSIQFLNVSVDRLKIDFLVHLEEEVVAFELKFDFYWFFIFKKSL